MSSNDFNKLEGLIFKLHAATSKASNVDGSFRKYHTNSIEFMKDLPTHLKRLEQGLRTAKVIHQN